uniref:Uncharacterized protein n=1 Tax=Eutreptiella gymnastica TaxID=73025 RepID=A0A6T2JAA5_9EUGL|mmetsp:Transcript_1618/g.2949  ORF Transcript_1618/g.2949 Transcript_1618/m.2949 type:complete len:155 (+) Transcript_1618:1056-1520(+)
MEHKAPPHRLQLLHLCAASAPIEGCAELLRTAEGLASALHASYCAPQGVCGRANTLNVNLLLQVRASAWVRLLIWLWMVPSSEKIIRLQELSGVDFQELIPSMDGRNPSPRGCARLHQPVRSVMQLGRTKCFSTVTNVAAATVPLYPLSLLQPP